MNENQTRVTVVDIKMPFVSMVIFMVKWAIASIPAFLILAFLFFFLGGLMSGLLGTGGMMMHR